MSSVTTTLVVECNDIGSDFIIPFPLSRNGRLELEFPLYYYLFLLSWLYAVACSCSILGGNLENRCINMFHEIF